jgi:hypothetical protein
MRPTHLRAVHALLFTACLHAEVCTNEQPDVSWQHEVEALRGATVPMTATARSATDLVRGDQKLTARWQFDIVEDWPSYAKHVVGMLAPEWKCDESANDNLLCSKSTSTDRTWLTVQHAAANIAQSLRIIVEIETLPN